MIRKLFEKFSPDPEAEAGEREKRIRIAACVILMEVAKSDYEFSSIERDVLEAILQETERKPLLRMCGRLVLRQQ